MVKSELWQFCDREPRGCGRIVPRSLPNRSSHLAPISKTDDPSAGVAVDFREGTQRDEAADADASFFPEFAGRSGFERFLHLQKTTGESPTAGKGVLASLNQKKFPDFSALTCQQSGHHQIDGDSGTGIFVTVGQKCLGRLALCLMARLGLGSESFHWVSG